MANGSCSWASLPLAAVTATDSNAIFDFTSWTLVVILVVALAWPLNVPFAALAYKLRNGPGKIDMDAQDFWWRAAFTTLCLFGASAGAIGLVYVLIQGAGMPRALTHLVVLLAYLPAAVWLMFWGFALEDMLQGLGLYVIYVAIPGLALFWIGRLSGLWSWLAETAPWLFTPA